MSLAVLLEIALVVCLKLRHGATSKVSDLELQLTWLPFSKVVHIFQLLNPTQPSINLTRTVVSEDIVLSLFLKLEESIVL